MDGKSNVAQPPGPGKFNRTHVMTLLEWAKKKSLEVVEGLPVFGRDQVPFVEQALLEAVEKGREEIREEAKGYLERALFNAEKK